MRKPEDVKRFQREFNKRNKDAGIDVSLTVDGIIGKETASARFTEAVEAKDPKTKNFIQCNTSAKHRCFKKAAS